MWGYVSRTQPVGTTFVAGVASMSSEKVIASTPAVASSAEETKVGGFCPVFMTAALTITSLDTSGALFPAASWQEYVRV